MIVRPMRLRAPGLVLLALGMAACGQSETSPPPAGSAATTEASLAVTLARAEERLLRRTVVASGPVAPWQEMQLGVELSGMRVMELRVDVGQRVRAGDVLLELDHRTFDNDVREANAAVEEARAGVTLAEANLKRAQAMAERQLMSGSDMDQLRARREQAQAQLGTKIAARDSAVVRRQICDLRAPDDGVISARLVQPGQVVMAGAELLRLTRQGRLEWRAELAESELAQVTVGAEIEITDALGKVVHGKVRAVSPGLNPTTRTGTLYADLPEPGSLASGALVEGRVLLGEATGISVPAASVVRRDGYPYVFTVDPKGVVARVRVRVGATDGDRIEVLEGVKAGDAVVLRGAGFLGEGDRVRVVPDTKP